MKKISLTLMVIVLMLATTGIASAAHQQSGTTYFVAHLSGADEVPARETSASGITTLQLNKTGDGLRFKLGVTGITNVVAAHIHCGAPGVNGPVGMTLYSGGAPGSGPFEGVLASGIKTAPDAGNGCGWATLADVVAAMRSGNTYVNVHTNDGVAPTNTGPGDFPGGEIRGQVLEQGLTP